MQHLSNKINKSSTEENAVTIVGQHSIALEKSGVKIFHKYYVEPGNWEYVRAFTECLMGYHEYANYSMNERFVTGDNYRRSMPGHLTGYRFDQFVYNKGNLDKCQAFRPFDPITKGMIVIVKDRSIPPWGWKYLPSSYAGLKHKARKAGKKSSTVEVYHPSIHYADVPRKDKIMLRKEWLDSKEGQEFEYQVPEEGR